MSMKIYVNLHNEIQIEVSTSSTPLTQRNLPYTFMGRNSQLRKNCSNGKHVDPMYNSSIETKNQ